MEPRALPSPRRDPVLAVSLGILFVAGLACAFADEVVGAARAHDLARALGTVAMLLAAALFRPVEPGRTRAFWTIVSVALAVLLALQLWRLLAGEPMRDPRQETMLFMGRYLFAVLALEFRPDRPGARGSEDSLRLLDTAGAVLFVFSMIAYVLVSPSLGGATSEISPLAVRVIFLVLDGFLILRSATLSARTRSAYWRVAYGLFSCALVLHLLSDLVVSLPHASPFADPAPRGLWLFGLVPVVFAARLVTDPIRESRPGPPPSPTGTRLAPLVGFAFAVPMLHFLLERLGIVSADGAGPRELVVLSFLGATAALAWVYQRVLIRENRRLERERSLMADQTAQTARLEALGRLAGGVAHDFNNLLTVIRGRTELILAEHRDDPLLREDLDAVREATRRGEDVTRQLLAFGRRQMLRPEVLDLGVVVADMAPLIRSAVTDEVRLSVGVNDPAPLIVADQGQLEMALLNLAVNARDAMPGGGQLAITVEPATFDAVGAAVVPDGQSGRYVLLTVRDTGRGMEESVRARIFEPFFTTKPFGSGAGLGLPAVHGFVRQTGGGITVQSAPGRGTAFRIYLPRVERPLHPAAEVGSATEEDLPPEPALVGPPAR